MGSDAIHTEGAPRAGQADDTLRFRVRDAIESRGHTSVANCLLEDVRLDPAVRLAYILVTRLVACEPGAPLSPQSLARVLGTSPGQARDALRALVEAGLLSIEARRPDGQPAALCIEPLASRYGGRGPGQADLAAAGPAPRSREPSRERATPPEARGAVIPIMTDQRRAFEDRLAARIPDLPGVPTIDPARRELGLERARRLREQLRRTPAGSTTGSPTGSPGGGPGGTPDESGPRA